MPIFNPSLATPSLPLDSIQFNNAGSFGGSANNIWDGAKQTIQNKATYTIGNVVSGTATQVNDAGGSLYAVSLGYVFDIYAYKTVGAERVYSATPYNIVMYDDGTSEQFYISLSWTAVTGASGYKVVLVSDDYVGQYNVEYDTGATASMIYNAQGGDTPAVTPSSPAVMSDTALKIDGNQEITNNLSVTNNVGIGTTPTLHKLNVVSGGDTYSTAESAYFKTTAGALHFTLDGYASSYLNFKKNGELNFQFGEDASLGGSDTFYIYDALMGRYLFQSGGGAVSINSGALHINSSGWTGLGVSLPTQRLDVNGSVRVRGGIYDTSNSVGTSGKILSSTGSGISWVTPTYLLPSGATTGATSQAQTFTNGVNLSNLTSGRIPFATTSGKLTDVSTITWDGTLVTLPKLKVTGAILDSAGGAGTSGQVLSSTVTGTSWITASGGGTPAGSNTYVQYNNSGSFGADINFYWNSGGVQLVIGQNLLVTGSGIYDGSVSNGGFKISGGNPIIRTAGVGDAITVTNATGDTTFVGVVKSGGYQSSDGSAGISTTVTTASLVGKTITIKNGLITGFA